MSGDSTSTSFSFGTILAFSIRRLSQAGCISFFFWKWRTYDLRLAKTFATRSCPFVSFFLYFLEYTKFMRASLLCMDTFSQRLFLPGPQVIRFHAFCFAVFCYIKALRLQKHETELGGFGPTDFP